MSKYAKVRRAQLDRCTLCRLYIKSSLHVATARVELRRAQKIMLRARKEKVA